MKFIKLIVVTLMIASIPLNAGKNKQKDIAGGLVAGIALLAIAAANSESNCELTNYKNYTIGKKMTAAPATAMVDDKWDACKSKVVLFTDSIQDTESYTMDITKGKVVESRKTSNAYKIQIATTIITTEGMLSGAEPEALYVSIDKDGVVIEADDPFSHMIGKASFELTDKIIIKNETFSQEIIYTGISGNELHFQYREYQGNSVRWPFTMNLIFDLEKSDIIKIKRYKIQILEADNTKIVYKVL